MTVKVGQMVHYYPPWSGNGSGWLSSVRSAKVLVVGQHGFAHLEVVKDAASSARYRRYAVGVLQPDEPRRRRGAIYSIEPCTRSNL